MRMLALGGTGIVCVLGSASSGATIDFEFPAINFGSYASITLPAGGGVDATFTPHLSAGTVVGVANIAFLGGRPSSWGNQALAADSWLVSFDALVFNGATIDFSYSAPRSGTAFYEVWSGTDGTGTLLDSGSQAFTGDLNASNFATLTIGSGPAFASIRFWDSLGLGYWDNLTLAVVPLPQAGVLGAAGLGVLAVRRRRAAR